MRPWRLQFARIDLVNFYDSEQLPNIKQFIRK